ncbi:MAG: FAD-dependent oxidoreductase, partial [Candidatus Korarchaeum sp.]
SELARESGVEVDERGFIKVDHWQRTNLPGVYAVGDVTGEPMQIAKAVGDGVRAAVDINSRIFGGAS